MTLALLIYVVTLFADIKCQSEQITHLSIILMFFAIAAYAISYVTAYVNSYVEDGTEKFRESVKKIMIVLLWSIGISITVRIILPSEKTSYMMVGGYLAENVANSEQFNNALNQAGNITGKLNTIVNNKLDAYIKETVTELTNHEDIKK